MTLDQFFNEWFGLFIDIALMAGIFCLWLIWYRNGKRQQHMEQLLIGTAQQLEEASMHLSQATYAIEQLKEREEKVQSKSVDVVDAAIQRGRREQSSAATPPSNQSLMSQGLPPQNSTQATMILRMQREGESEEGIADRLDIPLAQVRLMLKLHAASH